MSTDSPNRPRILVFYILRMDLLRTRVGNNSELCGIRRSDTARLYRNGCKRTGRRSLRLRTICLVDNRCRHDNQLRTKSSVSFGYYFFRSKLTFYTLYLSVSGHSVSAHAHRSVFLNVAQCVSRAGGRRLLARVFADIIDTSLVVGTFAVISTLWLGFCKTIAIIINYIVKNIINCIYVFIYIFSYPAIVVLYIVVSVLRNIPEDTNTERCDLLLDK